MIQIIKDIPANVAGFRASGEVTEEDYKTVVVPHVQQLIAKTGELNFMLQLDTNIGNFTAGAWLQDALLGIKNLTKWHRSSIVTDSDAIIKFTDTFSILAPGEYRGFKKEQFDEAVKWVSSHD
jgi:hypothetical protein